MTELKKREIMKKIIFIFCFLSSGLLIFSPAFADEIIDENAMFSSKDTVVDVAKTPNKQVAENTTTFSGEVKYININTQTDKNLDDTSDSKTAKISNYMLGNFFVDIRKKDGVKAFVNIQAYNLSKDTSTASTVVALKEFFMDFNSQNKIYFRAGKQVLQWGRCYLWNPTDFVNIDKQTFLSRIGYREGVNGIKMQIPFGTKYNFYSFLNFTNANEFSEQGVASKFEFLVKNTEMAFSVFTKKGYYSGYGYDFSTRLCKIDIYGETTLSEGDNSYQLQVQNGTLNKYRNGGDWVSKSSIGLNKNFDSPNFNDRYSVRTEFFYNSNGYSDNIFKDKTVYNYSAPITVNGTTKTSGTKADFVNDANIYDPNYNSKYYAAIFTNMNRFILSDMTLNLNFINNLSDYSHITSIGVSYTNLNDFTIGLTLNSYGGEPDAEYTYSKDKLMTQLTIGLSF